MTEEDPPRDDGRPDLAASEAMPMGDLGAFDLALEDLVEMSTDAILFLDRNDLICYWNRGAQRMFQYQPSEALGRNIRFMIPRDLLQAKELEWLRSEGTDAGVIYNHKTRRLRKDGRVLWVSLTRGVLHDSAGREIGVVATLRDMTEQHDREEELHRSRSLALVGELAAKIAHEVKNPLTGIYAALQVLEGQLDSSDPRREIFQSIGEEVMRLNGITQELLQFSRPNEPRLRREDVGALLRDLGDDLGRLSMVEPGQLSLEGLEPGLLVACDRELTATIFRNLILNGVQANVGKGQVRLSARRSDGVIAIDVADEGPGIPPSDRERVFEPFFTTKSRGTGLGLSIARKNIELQGGSIRLRSQKGRGATFRVEFPAL